MAIRKNRQYASTWTLLAETYHWVSLVTGEVTMTSSTSSISAGHSKKFVSKNQKEQIKYIEKALLYIKKALRLKPLNEEYQNMLKYYY